MLRSPCYIVGDTHLDFGSADRERLFVAFLRHLHGRAGSVVLNGDIFDFWFEWRHVIPREHFRVLAAIADLREAGTLVVMVAGNHDSWAGDVLTRDVGVTLAEDGWRGDVAGWRAHIQHGDGLRVEEDRGYRRMRRVLRHPAAVFAFRLLHPDLAVRLARFTSSTSRAHGSRDQGAGLRRVAMTRLATEPELDLLVFGHAHATALERAPRGGIYANAGSWLDEPTFLVVQEHRVELRRWDGSAEGELLNAVDRGTEEALANG
jgi:UDP-2,3-diacylglucosamine hydrolase